MIVISNTVMPSNEQWDAVIRGMRNPKNSWANSDSGCLHSCIDNNGDCPKGMYVVGKNDSELMHKLSKAGTEHRKFLRMIVVYADIIAPLYWWKEFDTYKVGTVSNSCSTMHKIHDEKFKLDDFSCEHLINSMHMGLNEMNIRVSPMQAMLTVIECLNSYRELFNETKDKRYWWQMIQLLPSSYNQKRTVMLNYEVLANIYKSRKNHKLDEWRYFCKWIEHLQYSDLITE